MPLHICAYYKVLCRIKCYNYPKFASQPVACFDVAMPFDTQAGPLGPLASEAVYTSLPEKTTPVLTALHLLSRLLILVEFSICAQSLVNVTRKTKKQLWILPNVVAIPARLKQTARLLAASSIQMPGKFISLTEIITTSPFCQTQPFHSTELVILARSKCSRLRA